MAKDRTLDRHVSRRLTVPVDRTCTICRGPFSTLDRRRKRCDDCTGNHAAWQKTKRDENREKTPDATELTCVKCKQTKPVCEFYRNRSTKTGYHLRCKLCHYRNDDLRRKNKWWTHYRLRSEDIAALLKHQGGGCALCETELTHKTLRVDHDHACDHAGKGYDSCKECVRGLLCARCNVFLGYLEPRTHLVDHALSYVGGLDWARVYHGGE